MEQQRFEVLCGQFCKDSGIGALGEKTLHAVVKCYLEPRPGFREVPVGRRVADIKNEQGIFEVQTRSFRALRPKLADFLPLCPVTVVYPVAAVKSLYWVDPASGELSGPRRSPKKGNELDLLYQMYEIKEFIQNENLHFEALLLETAEYRLACGYSRAGHRGSARIEQLPVALLGESLFLKPADFAPFLPPLEGPFTAKAFSKAARRAPGFGARVLPVLCLLGLAERAGKQKNAYLYEYK